MPEPNKQTLQKMQSDHLQFLETSFGTFKVSGVPIIRTLTYKTIQVINNIGLKEILGEGGEGDRPDSG